MTKAVENPRAGPGGPFLWGAATAAHQVEGNNTASDVWLLEHVQPTVFSEPSGDACDSLNRWREDLAIVRSLGLNAYRFSAEWARIEPVRSQFSEAYLDYYERIAEACRDMGLAAVVTFNHFTTPRWFATAGGWANSDAPALFARYCDRLARRLGGLATYVVTLNEPNLQLGGEWARESEDEALSRRAAAMCAAAAREAGSDRFVPFTFGEAGLAAANLAAGHRQARAAVKSANSALPVGLSLAIPEDEAAPGGEAMLEAKRREVYGPFIDAARDDEFLGVQTYSRMLIGAQGPLPPPKGAELTQMGDEYRPQSIGAAVRWAHAAGGRPILITENGVATENDQVRARFIPEAIRSVRTAMADGVPVLGYIHWSLMDNFEWMRGYGPKFGLVEVDRQSFSRTPKPSARVLGAIASANASPLVWRG